MNKSQLIDALSNHLEGSKRAGRRALEPVLATLTRGVARGVKAVIAGFGAFDEKVVRPAAQMARNARASNPGQLPASVARSSPDLDGGAATGSNAGNGDSASTPQLAPLPTAAESTPPRLSTGEAATGSAKPATVAKRASSGSPRRKAQSDPPRATRKRSAPATSATTDHDATSAPSKAGTTSSDAGTAPTTTADAAAKPVRRRSTSKTGTTGAAKRARSSDGAAKASSPFSAVKTPETNQTPAEAASGPAALWSDEDRSFADAQGTGGAAATPPPS